ncbi:MAG: biopolymer transporter ExbD, partial [Verrucomicrobia bacterium]|nr:biopolymer transporter ExbD [Verrucomicrobiota bacterium]
MNFRKNAQPTVLGFLIAPMVDILLVILVFFIVTWNFALSENELDVRVPTATKANEAQPYVGQVVINITANETVIVNRQQKSVPQLLDLLKKLSRLYQDQA